MTFDKPLAVGLALLICAPLPGDAEQPAGATRSLIEKVRAIPHGSVVSARLRTGEQLRGRIGAVTGEGFRLQYALGERVHEREVAYDEVKIVKQARSRSGPQGNETIPETVLGIAAGSWVGVDLTGGGWILGRMGAVSEAGFILQVDKGLGNRHLAFSEVQSLKSYEPGRRIGPKTLAVIVVVAGVAAVAVLYGAIQRRQDEQRAREIIRP